MEAGYVYKSLLKTMFGLTDRMIVELGEPDKTNPNPFYKKAAPLKLYSIERVEQWIEEHQDEVQSARAKRAKRAERRALANAEAKQAWNEANAAKLAQLVAAGNELLNWSQAVEIQVRPFPDNIRKRAGNYYIEREAANGYFRERYNGMSEAGVVAFARHRYTNYEQVLAELSDRASAFVELVMELGASPFFTDTDGSSDAYGHAYSTIKERVNAAVQQALWGVESTASA